MTSLPPALKCDSCAAISLSFTISSIHLLVDIEKLKSEKLLGSLSQQFTTFSPFSNFSFHYFSSENLVSGKFEAANV
jgi:hypothetical protein